MDFLHSSETSDVTQLTVKSQQWGGFPQLRNKGVEQAPHRGLLYYFNSRNMRLGHEMYVSFFCTASFRNMFQFDEYLANHGRDAGRNSCKRPSLLSDINQNWNVSKNVTRNCSKLNFMKIRSAVFELLHADRKAGRHSEAIFYLQYPSGCIISSAGNLEEEN
jgi:hypothetical protein